MSESEQKVIDRCESIGEAAVRTGLVAGDFGDTPTYFDRLVAERWLAAKDNASASASTARRDAREEETLSISRKALRVANTANILAAIATLVAVIALYVAIKP